MGKDKEQTKMMLVKLYETFLACETKEDVEMLLDDLCTHKEVEQMAQRITAAQMLKSGKTYAEIIEQTDISSATLSRVSRCVQYGAGGYEKFVKNETK